MKQSIFTILTNEALTSNVYKMTLAGDTSPITAPGQFVNLKLEGKFLRRPISVCDCTEGKLTLIYKVVGGGTEEDPDVWYYTDDHYESFCAIPDAED